MQMWDAAGTGPAIEPDIPVSAKRLLALIFEHYKYHNVKITENLSEFVNSTIVDLSKDPLRTLNAIERFLVPNVPIEFSNRRVLDWSETGGKEGLLLAVEEDGEVNWEKKPLYWKPEQPILAPPGEVHA